MAKYSITKTTNDIMGELTTHAHVFLNGTDQVEAVHQMRVAMRKLKTLSWIMEILAPEVDGKAYKHWVNKWMKLFAEIRDKDIAIGYLGNLDPGLAEKLQDERSELAGDLKTALSECFVAYDGFCAPKEIKEFFHALDKMMDGNWEEASSRQYKIMLKAYRNACIAIGSKDAERLHEFRLAGKKIKNTIDLFEPALKVPRNRVRLKLAALLRLLGELNDRSMTKDILIASIDKVKDSGKAKIWLNEQDTIMKAMIDQAGPLLVDLHNEIRRAIRKAARREFLKKRH